DARRADRGGQGLLRRNGPEGVRHRRAAVRGRPRLRRHHPAGGRQAADRGEAVEGPFALAEQVTPNAPLALAASKRILTEAVDWPDSEFWQRQGEIVGSVMTSEDAR